MKEQIIRILENRARKFESINHSFEAREVKSAIDTIRRLVPPELFAIHDVVVPKGTLCECKKHSLKTNYGFEVCTKCGNEFDD